MKAIGLWTAVLVYSFLSVPLCLYAEDGSVAGQAAIETQIQTAQPKDEAKARFEKALSESLAKLSQFRTSKNRALNLSIETTRAALAALAEAEAYPEAERLLKEAREIFPGNALAELILADVLEVQGKVTESNEAYLAFLKKAGRPSGLTRQLVRLENRIILMDYVRAKLERKGIAAPPARLPLLDRIKTEKNSLLLNTISIALPVFLIVATFFLIFSYVMTDGEAEGMLSYRVSLKCYAVLVTGYLFWLFRLFSQIPSLIRPEELEVAILICCGLILAVMWQVREVYTEGREQVLDETVKRCPLCKKVIPKLSIICPVCNKPIE